MRPPRRSAFDVDYKRLLREFQSRGTLVRAFYYTAVIEDQEFSSIRPLIDWLDYNGYTVVTKATKEFIDASGRRKVKGNMDIELAVDAMELAEHVDQIVLFSGDGDFRPLVEAVQRRGVRVTVVSTISSQPPMIADELRRQADVFTDLVELQSRIGRDPSERPAPRDAVERLPLSSSRSAHGRSNRSRTENDSRCDHASERYAKALVIAGCSSSGAASSGSPPRRSGLNAAGAACCSRRRDRLDLDHEIRTVQFRYLDQRHRRRRRRRDRGKETVSRLAIGSKIVHVGEEHRQLHQIGRRASARLQRHAEIVKHLRRLCRKIGLADHMAAGIERGLAGDEDDPAGADLDDLRIARRGAELGRIDAGNRGGRRRLSSGVLPRFKAR